MQTQPTASHFINGEYVEDTNGTPIEVIYPATGEVIATVYAATPEIVEKAITAARDAQAAWAAMTGTERGRILRRAADIMRERNHDLSILETYDTGKPYQETSVADATSGADALEYFGGMAATLTGEHIQLGEDWVYTRREPLGVCVGIGAWNYPTQIACWKGAPALACGNAVVFKPSETTPLSALKVAEILHEAGLPSGLYNVVQGMGEVGAALVTDARVDKVSLTGSVPTGRKVYAAAAEGMKHVTMELGGKSPMIVFEDANIENAVSGAILGNFYSSGQVCSNGTRVFVHKDIKEQFLNRLAARLDAAVIGDPMDPATNFGPMVSERQMKIALDYIAKGEAEGARLAYGGKAIDRPGFYVQPCVFADVTDDMVIAREEIFGPVLCVVSVETLDEAIAFINANPNGNGTSIFTNSGWVARRFETDIDVGQIGINVPIPVPVAYFSFTGSRASKLGDLGPNGKQAIAFWTQTKTVTARWFEPENVSSGINSTISLG